MFETIRELSGDYEADKTISDFGLSPKSLIVEKSVQISNAFIKDLRKIEEFLLYVQNSNFTLWQSIIGKPLQR